MNKVIQKINESRERLRNYTESDEMDNLVNSFDINSIPLEERRRRYIEYRQCYIVSKNERDEADKIRNINESVFVDANLKCPKSIFDVLEIFDNYYDFGDWQIKSSTINTVENIYVDSDVTLSVSVDEMMVIIADLKDNAKIIEQEMADNGYFLGKIRPIKDADGMSWLRITFNPMQSPNANEFLKNKKGAFYHATPAYNHRNILENGFVPSDAHSPFMNYKHRLFFNREYTSGFEAMMQSLAAMKDEQNPSREYYLYRLDVSDIVNSNDGYTFYFDPNTKGSFYTEDRIPYKFVEKATVVKFDKMDKPSVWK